MLQLHKLLSGSDLRSLRNANSLIGHVKNQKDFDQLFLYLYHRDRPVVMRAADTIEKITIDDPSYLIKHKQQIIDLLRAADHKELKWHVALLVTRVALDANDLSRIWKILSGWAADKDESRIVRVNSLQALFELAIKNPTLMSHFKKVVAGLDKENIPSLSARIRLIRRSLSSK